jgi:hypothetical protein
VLLVAAPLPVEYVPAEHDVQGWGAGACWGMSTSWLLVSGPLYLTKQLAAPPVSLCRTAIANTPVEKLMLAQTSLGSENQYALILLTPLISRDAASSLVRHTLYVPADTIVRLSEYVVSKLSIGVPVTPKWKLS